MAQGLFELLKKQHKFGGRDEVLEAKVSERMSGTEKDLEELKKRVRSILVSIGKPCKVSEIEKDYRALFGRKFPIWEIGFSSAVDVLRNIPEACTVEDQYADDPLVAVKTSEKSVHIFDLVKKNRNKPKEIPVKDTTPRDVFVPFNVQDGIRQILYGKHYMRKDKFMEMLEERYDLQYMGLKVPVESLIRSLPHMLHGDAGSVKSAYKIEEHEIWIPEEAHFDGEHVIPSYRISNLESRIAENISVLLEGKSTLFVWEIPQLYKKRFGKELNWHLFGFQDLWRFLQLLPGNFQLVKLDSDYIVTTPEIEISGTTDIRVFEAENFCGDFVYENVLKKIRDLILQVNKGLNAKYLESAYEFMYYEQLIMKTDLNTFLWHLHDIFIITVKEKGECLMLYPTNIQDIEEQKLRPPKISEIDSLETVYPEGILKPGDFLKSVEFEEVINIHNNDFCAAYVSSIESPSNFYITVIGMGPDHEIELDKEFNKLKMRMNKCYTFYSEKYIIPISHLKLDMICAVCVKGEWARAVILDLINDSRILVKLLDYGECHAVTMLNLRYLLNNFANLPCLACKASLFNLHPVDRSWSLDAIMKFHELVTEKHFGNPRALSVVIVHKNKQGDLQVVLTDICEDTELHIGDELVELGYASYKYQNAHLNALFS